MAGRLLAITLRNIPKAPMGSSQIHHLHKIGNREIVGYGWNGTATYADRLDFPMPPIRFREDTPDILVLREKEKGDWRKLSIAEKKALYRASFCQTFSEMKHPTGIWKMCIGMVLIAASIGLWGCLGLTIFVYQDMPETFDEEHQKAQLKRMLDLEMNPIHGIASQWDYETKKWKK